MIPEKSFQNKYWFAPYEGYEVRCRRRLQTDLGVDELTAEAILHLRGQVVELQAQLRRLEVELSDQTAIHGMRLADSRDYYYEANWIEIEIKE